MTNKTIFNGTLVTIYILFVSLLLEKIFSTTMTFQYEKYAWAFGPCQLDILESCDSEHIQFYLYSRKAEKPTMIKLKDLTPPANFDPFAETKVLIHGYAGSLEFNGTSLVRKAYLDHGRYNIIVVDWGRLVRLPCYPVAVLNTWQAGICTSQIILHLVRIRTRGFNVSKLHIIGFSLGAHVAAYTSNHLHKHFKKKIARITGLDPALPFFASLKESWKLDKDDANFVDIIHTNSGVFGKIEATGHVDFYLNGGVIQPACSDAHNPPLCSHLIATIYFAESILALNSGSDAQFKGSFCENLIDILLGMCKSGSRKKAFMGESCSSKTRGIYYVATAKEPPFARG